MPNYSFTFETTYPLSKNDEAAICAAISKSITGDGHTMDGLITITVTD